MIDSVQAEHSSRQRAWLMTLGALVLIVDGFLLTGSADLAFSVRGFVWVVLIGLWMLLFETGGGLLCSAELRALTNDERVVAMRSVARRTGLWVAMAGAMLLYMLDWWVPIDTRQAMRMLTAAALAATLLHYAWLETR